MPTDDQLPAQLTLSDLILKVQILTVSYNELCPYKILGAELGSSSTSQRSSGNLFQNLAVSVNKLFFSQTANSESTNTHAQKQKLTQQGKLMLLLLICVYI